MTVTGPRTGDWTINETPAVGDLLSLPNGTSGRVTEVSGGWAYVLCVRTDRGVCHGPLHAVPITSDADRLRAEIEAVIDYLNVGLEDENRDRQVLAETVLNRLISAAERPAALRDARVHPAPRADQP